MPRVPVPLRLAYRLLNHGPATLVGSQAGGRTNVMAAQWVMPIDFDPPRIAVVIDSTTFTRALVDGSGELSLSIPEAAQAPLVWRVGSTTGADGDKSVATFAGEVVAAPLVEGCLAWLECRVVHTPTLDDVARAHDLFVVEAVAAWADDRYWRDDHVQLGELRTLHHLGGGRFVASGEHVRGTHH